MTDETTPRSEIPFSARESIISRLEPQEPRLHIWERVHALQAQFEICVDEQVIKIGPYAFQQHARRMCGWPSQLLNHDLPDDSESMIVEDDVFEQCYPSGENMGELRTIQMFKGKGVLVFRRDGPSCVAMLGGILGDQLVQIRCANNHAQSCRPGRLSTSGSCASRAH